MFEDIQEFMGLVASGEVEIYNEFSLQHELGIFLRSKHPAYRVEFERNIGHFGVQKQGFAKREIDISIIERDTAKPMGVIELKYPRNGQIPEQVYSFCKDIQFIEQLVQTGFRAGAFVAVVDDPLFYQGRDEGIYSMFRNGAPIHGIISKPTGARDSQVEITGTYQAEWKKINSRTKWCLIEVAS
ncbi:hypothetical protein [Lacimicrobium alkaliphilum]|uniref:Uncharacterized protein n=1 Tax=Lacimicrobium alkaliphilum TaxID=1526571 RepID=A0A0U2Z5P8_9ALTE|nr:hypothetical protein [Lacimicrobium alkaliphilum]ALS98227.1 hypothetical protein AT746_08175 [Lacimicrobium alkaliphilum]